MKIVYSPRAIGDLRAISAYLRPRSPQGAKHVRAAIIDTIANLSRFPRSGRLQTTDGIRKMAVRRYTYSIYYTVDEDAEQLGIVSIQHTSRAPEFHDA